MRWIVLLFSLPNIVWAFQSSLSASYSDVESSAVVFNTASYKYYANDISYGNSPFTELAFLTSTSSVELFHGEIDYNNSGVGLLSSEGSYSGVEARLYQGKAYLGLSSSTMKIETGTLFDQDSRWINVAIGLRLNDTNMLYGLYSLQSIDNAFASTEVIETGFAFKSVFTNIVIYFQSTTVTEEQTPDVNETEILLQNFLDNNFYIALIYNDKDSELLFDQSEGKGLSIGGAVNKSNAFNLSYTKVNNAFNEKANNIRFTMSFGF